MQTVQHTTLHLDTHARVRARTHTHKHTHTNTHTNTHRIVPKDSGDIIFAPGDDHELRPGDELLLLADSHSVNDHEQMMRELNLTHKSKTQLLIKTRHVGNVARIEFHTQR